MDGRWIKGLGERVRVRERDGVVSERHSLANAKRRTAQQEGLYPVTVVGDGYDREINDPAALMLAFAVTKHTRRHVQRSNIDALIVRRKMQKWNFQTVVETTSCASVTVTFRTNNTLDKNTLLIAANTRLCHFDSVRSELQESSAGSRVDGCHDKDVLSFVQPKIESNQNNCSSLVFLLHK